MSACTATLTRVASTCAVGHTDHERITGIVPDPEAQLQSPKFYMSRFEILFLFLQKHNPSKKFLLSVSKKTR
jgi:hypothetical protein